MSRSIKTTSMTLCAFLVAATAAQAHRAAGSEARAVVRLPAALVGTWTSARGNAELVYVFRRDGTYQHAGVLLQPRVSGWFRFEVGAAGIVTVRDRTLVLRPLRGFEQLRDPEDPSRNYRRGISRGTQRYRWRLSGGTTTLSLTDVRTGVRIDYERG
jgi:hypothetical protein